MSGRGDVKGEPRKYDGEVCHDCGEPVARGISGPGWCEWPTWWNAPDDLWRRVVGDDGTILCPGCFTVRCRAQGITVYWQPVEVVELTPGRTAEDGVPSISEQLTNLGYHRLPPEPGAREPARAIRDGDGLDWRLLERVDAGRGFSDEDVVTAAKALARARFGPWTWGMLNDDAAREVVEGARAVLEAVFSRSPVGEEER